MPPKKSRAQAASAPPAEASQRQTRGRKRRLSDASNASDRPSSSQSANPPSAASTPAKRRKRTKKAAAEPEGDVIVEEEEKVVEELACDAKDGEDAVEGAESERKVNFSETRRSMNVMVHDSDKATATQMTPHPRSKMPIKRRVTASPNQVGESIKLKKVTSIRHSLPPSLTQDGGPAYEEQKFQFAPLNEVLEARKIYRSKQYHKREARIREIEAQLQFPGDDEDIEELQAELEELRQEHRQHITDDDSYKDDDMLVLESQQAVSYPVLPTTVTEMDINGGRIITSEEHMLSQSQSFRSKEALWDAERQQFQDAILALSREASKTKSDYQIIVIELQSLGLGGEGEDPKASLASIRESFLLKRESFEHILPGSLPEDATNEDFLDILLANNKEFANRLKVQDKELQNKSYLVSQLTEQVEGLIERLGALHDRKEKLEEMRNQLDAENENKERDIEDLQQQVQQAEDERDTLQDELDVRVKEVNSLEEEAVELNKNLDRLKQSLDHYREEEARLQALITKMENEHSSTLDKMNTEREETVRDLEDRLDEQTEQCGLAEGLAEERQQHIDTLTLRIEEIEKERDDLQVSLDETTAQRDEEHDARETAETELQHRETEVEDLEKRVTRLEEELAELTTELGELEALNKQEREQREAAEAELDEANQQIKELNTKLQAQGAEANELRQKLWQVQQQNEAKVKELETLASERDQESQEHVQQEIDRRDEAEAESQERAETIADLEARLEAVEQQMRESLAERDEQIAALQRAILEKDGQIETMRGDLQEADNRFEALEAQTTQEHEELESRITALQATIAEHEVSVANLQQDAVNDSALHASEMEDRDASIAELNHEKAQLNHQVQELETEKSSLERRVEQEAEQMLQLQAEKEDQIDALRAEVQDRQAKIQLVEAKVVEVDERWQEVLLAREEEIRTLHEKNDSSTEIVSTLTSEIEVMKRRFHEYVNDTTERINNMQADAARLKATMDGDGNAVMQEGADILEQIDAFGSVSQIVTTKTTSSQLQQSSSRKTRSKKRVQDSGIGMEADGEDETMIAA